MDEKSNREVTAITVERAAEKDGNAILGRMKSLEHIELCSIPGVTNVGLAFLANLPRLRQLRLSELPNATREAVATFPASVRIEYSV